MAQGDVEAARLNLVWTRGLRKALPGGERDVDEMAAAMRVHRSTLYGYIDGNKILPAFRGPDLVRAAAGARVAVAEHLIGARENRLVIIAEAAAGDAPSAVASPGMMDRALDVVVDSGALIEAIRAASTPVSDGGERITMAELEGILSRARALVHHSHELEQTASSLRLKVL